ncbi:MAG TPA: hypothetical protein VGS20_01135 [Candidatus Acidoferrales bacterium]|nr:hypothetical protein [Candidatus Acidoferrales bacterium]
MSKRIKWLIAALAAVFLVVIVYSSMEATRRRFEVCVEFRGRSHCALAEGRTSQDAIRSAQDIDCGLLAGDRNELMACESTPAQSVREVGK